jgi:hypothetical protein
MKDGIAFESDNILVAGMNHMSVFVLRQYFQIMK